MKRNVYLESKDKEEALSLFLSRLNLKPDQELIPVKESRGRQLAQPVFARKNAPHFNSAAMDGIAVVASTTKEARDYAPLTLIQGQDFMPIDTGDPIEPPYDAVIMMEEVIGYGQEQVQILKSAVPWQHIRPVGEDMTIGELIMKPGQVVGPVHLGALLNGGHQDIWVVRKPKVHILPTGSEVTTDLDQLKPGDIIESNGSVLKALVEEWGGLGQVMPITRDDPKLLKASLEKALEQADLVVINAGSSAGSEDYTRHVIEELGEVLVHGVAIKPGKPTLLAMAKGKPIIGVPGYPVSAYLSFELFAGPVIRALSGQEKENKRVKAYAARRIMSSFKSDEYVRVKLGQVGEKLMASPLSRGAGVTMSLVRADGVVEIPKALEGVEAGQEVDVLLMDKSDQYKKALVIIGSHDLLLDQLGAMMTSWGLSSSHVGSLGGVFAMMRKEAHLAPIHLLDPTTGSYNSWVINKYFSPETHLLIRGVQRQQGLMIPKGNPKQLTGLIDLTRKELVMANRQKGSGTRVLLDYLIKDQGLASENMVGYDREMTTHMMVAAAVKSGSADVGVGVAGAAKAMDLDFIPLGEEYYDFLVDRSSLGLPMLAEFIEVLKSKAFQDHLTAYGGYGFQDTGKIIEVTS